MNDALRALSALLGAAVFLVALPLRAEEEEPPPEAVEAARHGRELFEAGEYRQAIVELEAAYDAFPAPPLLHNLGRCYEELEDWCEAASYYRRFLRQGRPTGDVRREVVDAISVFEDRCEAERRGGSEPGGEGGEGGEGEGSGEGEGGEGEGTEVETRARLFDAGPAGPDTTATDAAGITAMAVGGVAMVVGVGIWGWLWSTYDPGCWDREGPDRMEGYHDECPLDTLRPWSQGADAAAWGGGVLTAIGIVVFVVGRYVIGAEEDVALAPSPGGATLQLAWF